MASKDEDFIVPVSAEIHNFQRITLAVLDNLPPAGIIALTGKNKNGKTSIIRSLPATFGGEGAVPVDVVNDGSPDGKGGCTFRLSNGFMVSRSFTEANPKGYLKIEGSDGGSYKQGKLNEFVGPIGFDALALFGLPKERITEILLSLSPNPNLMAELRAIRSRRKEIYDERTGYLSAEKRLKAFPRPVGERPVKPDVSQLVGHLRALNEAQRSRETIRDRGNAIKRKMGEVGERMAVSDNRIADLERLILEEKEKHAGLVLEYDTLSKEKDTLLAEYMATTDPAAEIEETDRALRDADRVAEAIKPWDAWERAMRELVEAKEAAKELTDKIKATIEEELSLLANSGIPVTGVSFDENGILHLHGHPLESASGYERIKMALEVAFALNPKLRVCLLDSGQYGELDDDAVEELHRWSIENHFQIWVCKIHEGGPGVEIVVLDGKAEYTGEEPETGA